MKLQTELAVVTMYEQLLTRHLRSRAQRLAAKDVMAKVMKRYGFTRSTVYGFIKKHKPTLLNARRTILD